MDNIFKKPTKKLDTILSVQVPQETIESIDRYSERAEMTRSAMARELIGYGLVTAQQMLEEVDDPQAFPAPQPDKITPFDEFEALKDMWVDNHRVKKGDIVILSGDTLFLVADKRLQHLSSKPVTAQGFKGAVRDGWFYSRQEFDAPGKPLTRATCIYSARVARALVEKWLRVDHGRFDDVLCNRLRPVWDCPRDILELVAQQDTDVQPDAAFTFPQDEHGNVKSHADMTVEDLSKLWGYSDTEELPPDQVAHLEFWRPKTEVIPGSKRPFFEAAWKKPAANEPQPQAP